MWRCTLCLHKSSRRRNLRRHLHLVHNIDDRDGKNITKDYAATSNGEDSIAKELQWRMPSAEKPMSEERSCEEGMHKPRLWIEPEENWKNCTEEKSECQQEPHAELTQEQFERLGLELRAYKCRILDYVLDRTSANDKRIARRICDVLKRLDLFHVNSHHEFSYEGVKIPGSNINSLLQEILMCCPRESSTSKDIPIMSNPKSCTLKLQHKNEDTPRESTSRKSVNLKNPPRCFKFESLYGDTAEYFNDNGEIEDEEDVNELRHSKKKKKY